MKIKAFFVCLFAGLLLTACQPTSQPVNPSVGLGGIDADSSPYFASAVLAPVSKGFELLPSSLPTKAITSAGGVVFQLGDYVTVVLPADALFEPGTSIALMNTGNLITETAAIIKQFPDDYVMVTAYTDGIGSELQQAKTSFQQSRKVALSLWQNGAIPNDKLGKFHFSGLADTKPIVSDDSARGLAINRRIEITIYPEKEKANMQNVLNGFNVGSISKEQANQVS